MAIQGRLNGLTILNTRFQDEILTTQIQQEGGHCLNLPSFDIVPLIINPTTISSFIIPKTESIYFFMSQYAVQYALLDTYISPLLKMITIGAVGKATTAALQRAGISVTLIPEEPSSEGLLRLPELQQLSNKNMIIFRGKSGRTLFDETLRQRGATVLEVLLYERVPSIWTPKQYKTLTEHLTNTQHSKQLNNKIHCILGLSVDSITYFLSHLEQEALWIEHEKIGHIPWLVMSHRVAHQAKKKGIKTIYTIHKNEDILDALIRIAPML